MDIYEKLRPKASQHEMVRMGRIATAVMVLIAMLWIPVVRGKTGLYEYLQSVQGYLAPPVFVVFFFGVFWKRLNAQGCFWAMMIGFVIGLFRMGVDTLVTTGYNFSGGIVSLDQSIISISSTSASSSRWFPPSSWWRSAMPRPSRTTPASRG